MTDGGSGEHPVLLFDGVCTLCNGVVRFIIPRDAEGRLRFAPLQSEAGQALLERVGLPASGVDSVVLVEGREYYTKSDAALRVARYLEDPYAWLSALRIVPRPVRDRVYDAVAASRYELFGRREQCMVPPPDAESRFLD